LGKKVHLKDSGNSKLSGWEMIYNSADRQPDWKSSQSLFRQPQV